MPYDRNANETISERNCRNIDVIAGPEHRVEKLEADIKKCPYCDMTVPLANGQKFEKHAPVIIADRKVRRKLPSDGKRKLSRSRR